MTKISDSGLLKWTINASFNAFRGWLRRYLLQVVGKSRSSLSFSEENNILKENNRDHGWLLTRGPTLPRKTHYLTQLRSVGLPRCRVSLEIWRLSCPVDRTGSQGSPRDCLCESGHSPTGKPWPGFDCLCSEIWDPKDCRLPTWRRSFFSATLVGSGMTMRISFLGGRPRI